MIAQGIDLFHYLVVWHIHGTDGGDDSEGGGGGRAAAAAMLQRDPRTEAINIATCGSWKGRPRVAAGAEQDSGALIIEVLDKGTGPSGPGMGNCQFKDPHHPSCQPAAAPSLAKDIAAHTWSLAECCFYIYRIYDIGFGW